MKASPFAGKSEPLTSSILYPRYQDVATILQDSSHKSAAEKMTTKVVGRERGSEAAAADGGAPRKKRKAARADTRSDGVTAEQPAEHTSEAVAVGSDAVTKKRKSGRADVSAPGSEAKQPVATKAKKATAKLAFGPSNAEEARQLRERLGIVAEPKAAPAPAKAFAFGFEVAAEPGGTGSHAIANGHALEEGAAEGGASTARDAAGGAAEPAADAEEDPAVRERLRRVRGDPSEQDLSLRVFVGGMPFSYEEEAVRDYWSYCGEIADLDLMRFPDSGRFRGIAFITFATKEGYEAALACDGEVLEQTRVKVEPCKTPRTAPRAAPNGAPAQHTGAAPKTPGYCVAYVGNIAFEATEADLRAVFEGLAVARVRMHTDAASGRFKGYAHVHFSDEASLDSAVQLSGTEFFGRQLKIGFAQPKK